MSDPPLFIRSRIEKGLLGTILDQKIRQRYKEIDINTDEKRIFSKDNILNEQLKEYKASHSVINSRIAAR